MKTALIATALALAAATSFAATSSMGAASSTMSRAGMNDIEYVSEGDYLVPQYKLSGKTTRAEVIAELKASQARMDWVRSGDGLAPRDTFVSTKTRAEVIAEFEAARRNGELEIHSRSLGGA